MYSTCIFCHASLGANESIEQFPVGRRLAFDAARGRLWVVCRSCERWNLSPLEERWEAIEECERLFRDTRRRVSTANIGLARLKEGTTLVRVGDPLRPEMAAWRYGDQFHRRRRKHLALVGAGAVALGGYALAGPGIGLFGGSMLSLLSLPLNLGSMLKYRTVARVPFRGTVLRLSAQMLKGVALRPDSAGGFHLSVEHRPISTAFTFRMAEPQTTVLRGDDALRVARHLLPRINRAGGVPADVNAAVGMLENARNSEQLFGMTASTHTLLQSPFRLLGERPELASTPGGAISVMPPSVRLALEMSLHEDDERRALEGELAELEDRWREAEEVASISDDMFLPSGVRAMLKRLKGDRD